MSDIARIAQLMNELGPMIDDIEMIQQPEEFEWVVLFEDGTVLEITWDEPETKLTFSVVVANLEAAASEGAEEDEDRIPEICTALLTYNFLWRETGGIRMALDHPDGNVLMLLDVFSGDLEVTTLAGISHNFVETARVWRDSVLIPLKEAAPATGEAGDPIGGLRV